MAQDPQQEEFGALAADLGASAQFRERPYRALGQDNVRAYLALGLVGALIVLILALALRAPFTTWDEFVQLAQLLIGALSGLVGIAVGFYLSDSRRGDTR